MKFPIDAAQLTKVLTACQRHMCDETYRPHINSIAVRGHEKGVDFVATTGHRLIVVTLPIAGLPDETHVIPGQSIKRLIAWSKSEGGPVTFRISTRGWVARSLSSLTSGRCADEKYPPYTAVVDGAVNKTTAAYPVVRIDPDFMIAASKSIRDMGGRRFTNADWRVGSDALSPMLVEAATDEWAIRIVIMPRAR